MRAFNRLKLSTAAIAALTAGMVVFAVDANATDGDSGHGNGAAAAVSAERAPPVSKCWVCGFVKHENGRRVYRKPARDMIDHDKDHDRTHLDDLGIEPSRREPTTRWFEVST